MHAHSQPSLYEQAVQHCIYADNQSSNVSYFCDATAVSTELLCMPASWRVASTLPSATPPAAFSLRPVTGTLSITSIARSGGKFNWGQAARNNVDKLQVPGHSKISWLLAKYFILGHVETHFGGAGFLIFSYCSNNRSWLISIFAWFINNEMQKTAPAKLVIFMSSKFRVSS